jgi:MinD-like ATPase involved in chromosome partitioning or flagellar assembly
VERVVHAALDLPGERGPGWRRRAKVVAGGLGPGRPDPEAHDASRARSPLARPACIVFLGCTGGAGQTTVAALTARTLAGLRAEPVAVVDLNPGGGSLSEQLREAARSSPFTDPPGGIEVIAPRPEPEPVDALIGEHYQLTLLDPAAAGVARVLPLADQLVLVAPASSDAPRAVAMTQEWLDGHGYGALFSRAITVVNGVSKRSLAVTEQAEAVARGRCHAIVRVPWDPGLAGERAAGTDPAALRLQTRHAYVALAAVIVNALAVTKTLRNQEREAATNQEREEGRALR